MMSQQKKSEYFEFIKVSAIIFIVLFIVYGTVIINSYGYSDDYRLLYRAITKEPYFPETIVVMGRPLFALSLAILFPLADNIENLKWIRFLSLVGITLFCAFLANFYYHFTARSNRLESIAVSLVTCFMPGFGVYASWTCTFEIPYAAVLALLSAYFCGQGIKYDGKRWQRIVFFLVSGLLLILSCMIYQVASLFFILPVSLYLWFSNSKICLDSQKYFYYYSLVFFASEFCYLLIHKITVRRFILEDPFYLNQASRSEITDELLQKIFWFFQYPLKDALSLSFVPPNSIIAGTVISLIVIGMICFWKSQGITLQNLALIPYFFLSLIIAFLLPILSREYAGSYRTQGVLSSLVILWIAFALRQIIKSNLIRNIIWIAFVCVAAYSIHNLVLEKLVFPQIAEYKALQTIVDQWETPPKKIGFILAKSSYPSLENPYHEYGGKVSVSEFWVVEGMTYLVMEERFGDLSSLLPSFSVHTYNSKQEIIDNKNYDREMTIIDGSQLLNP